MTNFPDAISVLSAMITPAVLISACGSLILATSDRLSKAVTRTREISSALIPRAADQRVDDREEERRMLFTQLDFVTTRSRLLQRALSRLYAALAFFVGTSVAIGLVAITRDRKSTRLNSSHSQISYAVFCLKKKKKKQDALSFVKIKQKK